MGVNRQELKTRLVRNGAVAAGCFCTGKLGLLLALPPHDTGSLWLAAGVALAAVLAWGPRVWPGILFGATMANITTPSDLALAFGLGLVCVFRSLLAAHWLERFAGGFEAFNRIGQAARFLLVTAAACAVTALIASGILWSAGKIPAAECWAEWRVLCLGDVVGILVATPLLRAWSAPDGRAPTGRGFERLAWFCLLCASCLSVFGSGWPSSIVKHMPYLLLVFPAWAACRFGIREITTGTGLMAVMSLWYTRLGTGPFAGGTSSSPLFEQELYAGMMAVAGLSFVAVVNRHKTVEASLREARDELEMRIQTRTAELLKTKAQLEEDIRQRQRMEEALAVSEQRFRAMIEKSADVVALLSTEGAFLYQSPAVSKVLGYGETELVEENAFALCHPEDEPMLRERFAQLLASPGGSLVAEFRYRHKDGSWRWIEAMGTNLLGEPALNAIVVNYWDVSMRKQSEAALRKSEASLAAAQRITHLGSWEVSLGDDARPDPGTLAWSDEVFRIFGYEPGKIPVSGQLFYEAVHPDDRDRVASAVREALQEGKPYRAAHRLTRPDGTIRQVQEQAEIVFDAATAKPLRLVGTVQDITERQRIEDQLRQALKMEAVGQLAGGIAHDFNNILTVIKGHLGLVLSGPPLAPGVAESLREVEGAAGRAANLTRQLLMFSRRQVLHIRQVDLNDVVANVYKLLHRVLGEHIALECRYGPNLPLIDADAGMIEQVIMNLAVNARDAMPGGGRLTIGTAARVLSDDEAWRHQGGVTNRWVSLEVADTGCGMVDNTLKHLFEPFFTTKPVGKGTGLGLATAYGIIKLHHGWIDVQSQEGRGTQFSIFLPVSTAPPPAAIAPAKEPEVRGGSESILLVEDEREVRILARTCLRRFGYRVVEAAHGVEALRLWKEEKGRVDLLLTDMVMPEGISGRELAIRLKALAPRLKVIYASGYSLDIVGGGLNLVEGQNYIPKPYDPQTLAKTVRTCLDAT